MFLSQLELQADQDVVVYDQNSSDPAALAADSFLSVLLVKLERSFSSVHLLKGQFLLSSDLTIEPSYSRTSLV